MSLQRNLYRPGLDGLLLEVRLEDVFIQTQHQVAALHAQSCVVIQAGHPLIPIATVNTLIFV